MRSIASLLQTIYEILLWTNVLFFWTKFLFTYLVSVPKIGTKKYKQFHYLFTFH
jgi:hypothetical protein